MVRQRVARAARSSRVVLQAQLSSYERSQGPAERSASIKEAHRLHQHTLWAVCSANTATELLCLQICANTDDPLRAALANPLTAETDDLSFPSPPLSRSLVTYHSPTSQPSFLRSLQHYYSTTEALQVREQTRRDKDARSSPLQPTGVATFQSTTSSYTYNYIE